jgi:predicted house-cleaning NTP pyrophosphatase (Maf/HAM1 superfamily)
MTGAPPLAGVLGWPIGHSRSPRLHGHWLARYRIEGYYVPIGLPPEDFASGLLSLPGLGFRGVNVTIPHKEAALALATEATERAREIGADQVLSCDDRLFDKPRDAAEAREQLATLRGRTHELHAAAVIYEDARPVWRHVGRAQLSMRPFSDGFLDDYVAAQGAALCETVGGYRIEAGGAQLFVRVQGDLFTIMGLPLLELLAFLRSRGAVRE